MNKWSAHRKVTFHGKFGIQNICSFSPPFLLACTHIGPFYNLYTTPRSVVSNTLGLPVSNHWKFCSHNKRITNTKFHNHRFDFCFSAWELCLSYENGPHRRASLALPCEGKRKQFGFHQTWTHPSYLWLIMIFLTTLFLLIGWIKINSNFSVCIVFLLSLWMENFMLLPTFFTSVLFSLPICLGFPNL